MKKTVNKKIYAPRGGQRRTIESGRNKEFTMVETANIGKNPFDHSHNFAFTGNIGDLIPTLCKPCYPGDKWQIGADMLVRLQALVAPAMYRLDVRTDFFFVPYRLVWENFEKFIRNDDSGSGLPAHPYVTLSSASSAGVKKFCDYIGIATTGTPGFTEDVNALYGAAYNKIWNDWYRSQQLSAERDAILSDGDNSSTVNALFNVAKVTFEHDYFTSALPDPQLGASPVDIPLGTIILDPAYNPPAQTPHFESGGGTNFVDAYVGAGTGVNGEIQGFQVPLTTPMGVPAFFTGAYNPDGTLLNTPVTLQTLRRAEIVQEWLEKSSRGGNRYTEMVLMHFDVTSPDARLQRPEFITGVTSPVHISEVLNTTGEVAAGGLPQGNMAGHGVSVAEGNFGDYFCQEHGCIIGLTYILPKPAYYQGIPKDFHVPQTPLDYMWPSFAHIGEEEILVRELKAYEATSTDVFGYIPRYSNLKYSMNRIGGLFKTTMKYWTFARDLGAGPTLSETFLYVNPVDFTEPFAVDDDDLILFNIYFKLRAIRALPTFSTPHL